MFSGLLFYYVYNWRFYVNIRLVVWLGTDSFCTKSNHNPATKTFNAMGTIRISLMSSTIRLPRPRLWDCYHILLRPFSVSQRMSKANIKQIGMSMWRAIIYSISQYNPVAYHLWIMAGELNLYTTKLPLIIKKSGNVLPWKKVDQTSRCRIPIILLLYCILVLLNKNGRINCIAHVCS